MFLSEYIVSIRQFIFKSLSGLNILLHKIFTPDKVFVIKLHYFLHRKRTSETSMKDKLSTSVPTHLLGRSHKTFFDNFIVILKEKKANHYISETKESVFNETWNYNITKNAYSGFSIATMLRVVIMFFELEAVKISMQKYWLQSP